MAASSWSSHLQQAWLSRRDPLAQALWPLSLLFAALVAGRRALHRSGLLHVERVGLPVIVVGNRIVGGAGKTPTVLALLQHLRERGARPGVISRGYGRQGAGLTEVTRNSSAQEVGDEPLLIHLRGGVPVMVGRDRVAAAEALRTAHPEITVIVSDDGLQHLRLARDIEVLVFDERGAGNGWLLPAGPLREPLQATSTAHTQLVLYNAAAPSTALAGKLALRRLAGIAPLTQWWAGQAPQGFEVLGSRKLLALAGMARPERFFASLREAGLSFDALPLPDHYDYRRLPWPQDATDVLITEKDAVKLDPARLASESPSTRVWVVTLDFDPGAAFFAALDAALNNAPTPSA
ncbi:MAG TPA: tetraacyldisaccharide 4'-kinase [Methylibium sp.]